MEEKKFRIKDLIASLVIGEIAAWLLIPLAKQGLSAQIYQEIYPLFKFVPVVLPIICAVCLFIAYLIAKKIAVIYQVAKFVLVGGLNTLVDWGILALASFVFFKFWGITADTPLIAFINYYTLYKGTSFILATGNSYAWNKLWTFKRQTDEETAKEFVQFLIISIIGFLINVGIASGVFKLISLPFLLSKQWELLAAAVATVFSMIWNFLGYKFIVFDVKGPEKPSAVSPSETSI